MNTNEKKSHLLQYRLAQAKIIRLKEMIDAFPDCAEQYTLQLICARQLRDRIETEIGAVDEPLLRELLSQKYLCGKTLEEIALRINYSLRQTQRLHRIALDRFQTVG